jgi:HK97 family phage portal protein
VVRSVFNVVGSLFNKNADASPVPYAAPGRYIIPALSGRSDNEVYMRTMGTAGTIFQIVSILAGSVAAPQWRLYRKAKADGRVRYTTGDRGSDQRTEVLQHLALNVWNNPNPFNTGSAFREAGQQHMELTGEQWWVVSRDSRATFPTGLWLVRPDRMEPVTDAETYIKGYVYTGPSGERVPLMPDEVILTKFPNPLDPYRGLGPVQSVLVDLDAMKYGAEWNRNFFINGATPGGIVTVPNNMSDDEFDTFTNRWREAHQGVARAHRVAVLEGGATWSPTQISLRDMDFSNLRKVSRDVIREAWGIHQSMLGNSEDVNRSNAQTAEEVFGRWKVIPRLDRIRDTLNNVFLPMFGATGEGVEFDYVNPLPDDREADNAELTAKTTAWAALVNAGADPDDAAEVVGLPAMKMVAVPALPTPAPAPATDPGELEQAGESNGEPAEDDNQPGNRMRERFTARAISNAAATDHDPAAVDLSEMDAQHQQAADQLAADYQQQITPDQQQQALDQIRQLVESEAIGQLGNLIIDYEAAKALLLLAMMAFGKTAAHQAVKEAAKQGVTITAVAPTSTQLNGIAESTASLMASELATSAGREATRIAGGVSAPSADTVVTHVEKFLQGLSTAGPAAHLGGALAAAANQARHATFTAGPRCELIASEIRDTNTCSNCEEIDGHSFGYSDDAAAVAAASAAYPTSGYIHCQGLERCRGALIARYEAVAEPENKTDTSLLTMLRKIVDLIEPETAPINGHDHEREVLV